MTKKQTYHDWQPIAANDFAGRWNCFDATGGRCPAKITCGTIEIGPPVVGGANKAVIQFKDLQGFPAERFLEADFKAGGLELAIDGGIFRIIQCGWRNGRRVIHGESISGAKPGSWTAEEEDTEQQEPTPPGTGTSTY